MPASKFAARTAESVDDVFRQALCAQGLCDGRLASSGESYGGHDAVSFYMAGGAPSCREDAAGRIVDWIERHALGPDAGTRPASPGPQDRDGRPCASRR